MKQKFRHEYKFGLSPGEYMALRSWLRAALPLDPHAGPKGEYRVHSVYFDNLEDKALREKLDGVNCREKFRVRWYNEALTFLSLEKKSKRNGLCQKTSCRLTVEEAIRLFHGDTAWMRGSGRPLAAELAFKMETQGLRPKVLVDYVREPFVFPAGNVRITLDREIRSGAFSPELLARAVPTLPTGGQVLLEVKYDEFFPDFLRDIVQLGSRGASAFSKYAVCRRYG